MRGRRGPSKNGRRDSSVSARSVEAGDYATRDLLECILKDEEHHVDWLEAQKHKINEVGYDSYLAQQIYHRD